MSSSSYESSASDSPPRKARKTEQRRRGAGGSGKSGKRQKKEHKGKQGSTSARGKEKQGSTPVRGKEKQGSTSVRGKEKQGSPSSRGGHSKKGKREKGARRNASVSTSGTESYPSPEPERRDDPPRAARGTTSHRTYRLVVLGAGGAGKSAITQRFVRDVFVERYDPTIEDSYRTHVERGSTQCVLDILDTAGTEQFTTMRDFYMTNGDGFILVYCVDQRDTFKVLPDLREQIRRIKDAEQVPLLLVGNKIDLEDERVIATEEGRRMASGWGEGCGFVEASAKTKHNIDNIFFELIDLIERINPPDDSFSGSWNEDLEDYQKQRRQKCVLM